MTQTINYPFIDEDNYTFNSDKIEVTGGSACLKAISNPGQSFTQTFTADTGFTYDATKTEFSGGKLQQIDQAPTNATCWATYTTDINLNYGAGILTGTAVGGASVSSGRLDLKGGTLQYVDYSATSNADSQQTGCVRLKLTPNYTGNPATLQNIVVISKTCSDADNLINVYHKTDGNFRIVVNSLTGTTIYTADKGVWSPTSGTTYELEFNWNIDAAVGVNSELRLFIDGVQFGTTGTSFTGTRDANIGLLRIGTNVGIGDLANFEVEDLLVFDTVQHTANYTAGYTLQEARYLEDLVVIPSFSYSGIGSLQSFTTFTTTQTGAIKFNIAGQYWTGSAWAGSDDTYAQMNSPTDINTAIVNLIGVDTVPLKLRTINTNTLQDIDLLTLGYIGQIYPTDNPSITPTSTFNAEEFTAFTESVSDVNGDTITYTRKTDSVEYYWTGTVWATSSGYSQSNTSVEMNTADNFTGGVTVIVIYIHSDDGSATPSIDQLTIIYDTFAPPDALPSTCDVTGYILDSNNQLLTSGTVTAMPVNAGFITDKNWLVNLTPIQATLDSTGRFELELIRSTEYRNAIKYNFKIVPTSSVITPISYNNVTIPDSATADFNDIVTTT